MALSLKDEVTQKLKYSHYLLALTQMERQTTFVLQCSTAVDGNLV